jgi:hypothetical protein
LYFSTSGFWWKSALSRNRPVEQVLQARLEVADQVAVQEHFLALAALDVAVPLQHDTVLCKRAGLVPILLT